MKKMTTMKPMPIPPRLPLKGSTIGRPLAGPPRLFVPVQGKSIIFQSSRLTTTGCNSSSSNNKRQRPAAAAVAEATPVRTCAKRAKVVAPVITPPLSCSNSHSSTSSGKHRGSVKSLAVHKIPTTISFEKPTRDVTVMPDCPISSMSAQQRLLLQDDKEGVRALLLLKHCCPEHQALGESIVASRQ